MSGCTMRVGCSCGACAGVTQSTPVIIDNSPGLSSFPARVGTYSSFFASMIAGLSDPDRPALAPLTVRTVDDFSIAMLDAFAMVADIHTFYQERFAQENYLRTATELRSVLQLAGLIGYELNPGVAASVPLAFGLNTTAGTPTSIDLPVGTQAQSTPGPGQQAQVFETIEDITAYQAFSALTPQQAENATPRKGDSDIYLQGISLSLKPGDPLVIVGPDKISNPSGNALSERWDFRRIASVTTNAQTNTTHVVLERPIANEPGEHAPRMPSVYALRKQASLFGYNAQRWLALPFSQRVGDVNTKPNSSSSFIDGIYAESQGSWNDQKLEANTTSINLDSVYSQITVGSWIVLTDVQTGTEVPAQLFNITSTADTNIAQFGLTGRVTQVGIAGNNINWFSPLTSAAYVQSELLTLAQRPVIAPVEGGTINLSNYVSGLTPGRSVIVSGPLPRVTVPPGSKLTLAPTGSTSGSSPPRPLVANEQLFVTAFSAKTAGGKRTYTLQAIDGFTGTVTASEKELPWTPALSADPLVAELASTADVHNSKDLSHSIISLAAALTNVYDRTLTKIYANVAAATAGQTVRELLGSGDGSTPFQSFTLKQPPLTYVSAATPTGGQSTLTVSCNNTPWTLVDTLYDQGPAAQVFSSRNDENQNTTVLFGDGVLYGARLPSGTANIQASYRKGLGSAGNVDAGQINILLSRPLGLKSVINPIAASGGADPQPLTSAAASAPLSVSTLGRAVSILDYQNFALNFAGIAKALATWTWVGSQRAVVLTVAGIEGAAVDADSDTATKLIAALADFGDPNVPLLLQSYAPMTFELGINILPSDPNSLVATQQAVEAALRAAYSFDARSFGQWVSLSDVLAVAQGVSGVTAVQITQLYLTGSSPGLNPLLAAASASAGGQGAGPAQMLTLDPGPLGTLGAMS